MDKKEEKLNFNIVVSELYDIEMDIDAMKQILLDSIKDIIVASRNKVVFVFDRDFDDKKLYSFFRDNSLSFIIRLLGKKNLYYKGEKTNFKNLSKKVKLAHSFTVNGDVFSAGIIDVEISLNSHPRNKNPDLFSAKLLVGKYKKRKESLFILFSLPDHNDLSEKELIEFVFNAYGVRERINEIQRHIKNEYNWVSIRLGSYQRLKTFNTILWIVVDFVYKMKSLKIDLFRNI